MVESVISATIRTIKDLRRPGEELIIFYLDDNKVKNEVVKDEFKIRSRIYNDKFLNDIAYPVFAESKDLENTVATAKWEVNGQRVESKLFIMGIEPIFNILSLEINRSTLLRLYMEQSVAERLGIEDKQQIIIFPSHHWRDSFFDS
jgi:hypothetical protein